MKPTTKKEICTGELRRNGYNGAYVFITGVTLGTITFYSMKYPDKYFTVPKISAQTYLLPEEYKG